MFDHTARNPDVLEVMIVECIQSGPQFLAPPLLLKTTPVLFEEGADRMDGKIQTYRSACNVVRAHEICLRVSGHRKERACA